MEKVREVRVTTERIRALFGNAGPVQGEIWERQFDELDEDLQELAKMPWDELVTQNLAPYIQNLKYATLQPEVFRYLFPACLKIAQSRLMAFNVGYDPHNEDFFDALCRGNWRKVATQGEIQGTYRLLTDGLLDRLDLQRGWGSPQGFPTLDDDPVVRSNWLMRFNTLSVILPSIEPVWTDWWTMPSPGSAVAALEYAWGFAATDAPGDDLIKPYPFCPGDYYCEDATFYEATWRRENIDFFRTALTFHELREKAEKAAALLRGEPEREVAAEIAERFGRRRDLVEPRIAEFLAHVPVKDFSSVAIEEWKSDQGG